MGLRPSVKSENERSNNDKPRRRMIDSLDAASSVPRTEDANNGADEQPKTQPPKQLEKQKKAPLEPPKQEAWTARGKLLLNFHDAIARAINSPEMIQKCSQIASEMSTSADDEELPSLTLGNGATASNCKCCKTHGGVDSDYEAEASLIVDNKSKRDAEVRNKSLAVGVFSFLTLRLSRNGIPWLRNFISRRINSGYQFDKLPNGGSTQNKIFLSNQIEANSSNSLKSNPGALRKSFSLFLDVSISTGLTFLSGTYLFMPRPAAYIEDMAELPMVEGKSLYAEIVCPPLIKEYKSVLEQYGGRWPVQTALDQSIQKQNDKQIQLTQEDVSLNIIRKFVENCSKRSKYERALLEHRNAVNSLTDRKDDEDNFHAKILKRITALSNPNPLPSTDRKESKKLGTVAVPSPGVPEDIAVNLDQDVYFLGVEDENIESR